jgi:hypothetical protein
VRLASRARVSLQTGGCDGGVVLEGGHHEVITENWQRLDDAEWTERVLGKSGELPSYVPWTSAFMAP